MLAATEPSDGTVVSLRSHRAAGEEVEIREARPVMSGIVFELFLVRPLKGRQNGTFHVAWQMNLFGSVLLLVM